MRSQKTKKIKKKKTTCKLFYASSRLIKMRRLLKLRPNAIVAKSSSRRFASSVA